MSAPAYQRSVLQLCCSSVFWAPQSNAASRELRSSFPAHPYPSCLLIDVDQWQSCCPLCSVSIGRAVARAFQGSSAHFTTWHGSDQCALRIRMSSQWDWRRGVRACSTELLASSGSRWPMARQKDNGQTNRIAQSAVSANGQTNER